MHLRKLPVSWHSDRVNTCGDHMQMEYIFCWTESDKDEREPPESLQGQGGCLIRQLQTEPNIPTYNTQGHDLCSVILHYWTWHTKQHRAVTLKLRLGHLPINNCGWKCWGDVSCCQRGSSNFTVEHLLQNCCQTVFYCLMSVNQIWAQIYFHAAQLSRRTHVFV